MIAVPLIFFRSPIRLLHPQSSSNLLGWLAVDIQFGTLFLAIHRIVYYRTLHESVEQATCRRL